MKTTTCKNLRGACDAAITGETADEMGENSKKHVMEQVAAGDEAHKAAIADMMALSKEEQMKWHQGFVESFDSLEETQRTTRNTVY